MKYTTCSTHSSKQPIEYSHSLSQYKYIYISYISRRTFEGSLVSSFLVWRLKKAKGVHMQATRLVHLRTPMCTMRVTPAEKLHEGMQIVDNMRRPLLVVGDSKLYMYTRLISVGTMRMQNKTGYATRGNNCLKAFLCSRLNTFSPEFPCAR